MMTPPRIIAIWGGIGAGKSVVSRILRVMGYEVYDCDLNARRIMDRDVAIIERIGSEVCAEAVSDGRIDRRRLAECVFSDADALARLNGITHRAVLDDIRRWAAAMGAKGSHSCVFVETAILTESGLDRMVDEAWFVKASEEVRIERVMKRNGLTRDEVKARIENQSEEMPDGLPVSVIVNDGSESVISQISTLLTSENG